MVKNNEIVFKRKFGLSESIHVNLDTNVLPDNNMQYYLDDPHFAQIHIMVVGSLIMFTENTNLPNGDVNGATATMTCVNVDTNQNVISILVEITNTSMQMLLK